MEIGNLYSAFSPKETGFLERDFSLKSDISSNPVWKGSTIARALETGFLLRDFRLKPEISLQTRFLIRGRAFFPSKKPGFFAEIFGEN
jgi:hypothetical protein